MKLNLNFKELEKQWKERQLDLFPWLDGLFALLRTQEAMMQETEKRLSAATPATKVQFLSSDEKMNVTVAHKTIKKEPPESILPILLYSLKKVDKKGYLNNVADALLDFHPVISFGYLIGYLNLSDEMKDQTFQILTLIFSHFSDHFPSQDERKTFLDQLFQALRQDIQERMPNTNTIQTIEEFNNISIDLEIMRLIFLKNNIPDVIEIIEKHMQELGKSVIISLSTIPFKFMVGELPVSQFIDIIEYIALMRLKADRAFVLKLPVLIKDSDLLEEDSEEIIKKAEVALNLIDNHEKSIHEVLEELNLYNLFEK